eukprot:CAMPEP_0182853644 /NCGR_PEP_ID=MMETSP0034_2-20130328/811_1 /TAXON_ID=156128 /ORGANISM="Nephroselmis pyriformis, Strain CCMP717" /LENGTH=292 /DNA_ID=CAMNT_0024984423 /DNA_START=183 /DNA_END=1061 /DNA_ORIENTATION=-
MSPPTVLQNLLRKIQEDTGAKPQTKPLLSRYLVKGLALPYVNTDNLVIYGSPTKSVQDNMGKDPEMLAELAEVVPENDFSKRYKTCAAVGNSVNLKMVLKGPEIDSFDAILRFNDAPVKGFEDFVGRRATFRAITPVWGQKLIDRATEERKMVKLGAKTAIVFGNVSAGLYINMRRRFTESLVYALSPELEEQSQVIFDTIKGRLEDLGDGPFSSAEMPPGLQLVVFLMQVCEHVHVYGFDPVIDASSRRAGVYFGEKVDKHDGGSSVEVLPEEVTFLVMRVLSMEGFIHLH